MHTIAVFTLLVVSTQGFLFGPGGLGGLGGLFGPPAGGCDPCAAARAAPYYPQQPAYQAPAYQAPAYQAPAYQAPAYQVQSYSAPRPVYAQPASGYQTAPVQTYQPQPAPATYQQTVVAEPEPVQAAAGGYVQPPPPPPAYATGPSASAGYKKF